MPLLDWTPDASFGVGLRQVKALLLTLAALWNESSCVTRAAGRLSCIASILALMSYGPDRYDRDDIAKA